MFGTNRNNLVDLSYNEANKSHELNTEVLTDKQIKQIKKKKTLGTAERLLHALIYFLFISVLFTISRL
jgi:hypothetical protein